VIDIMFESWSNPKMGNDNDPLSDISTAALRAELSRRLGAGSSGKTFDDFEQETRDLGAEFLNDVLYSKVSQNNERPALHVECPKCERWVRKRGLRTRTVRTTHGPVSFKRTYYYCEHCKYGFYPLDRKWNLPEEGNTSAELNRRILDFGVNSTYEQACERFELHYGISVSTHLMRNVVSRAGRNLEASDARYLEAAVRAPPEPGQVEGPIVVETDGSMIKTRDYPEAWKEVKGAVLYRLQDRFRTSGGRGGLCSARYVARLSSADIFKEALDSALFIERGADHLPVVWLGDGAQMNWRLCDELCPSATQILDFYHAMEHASDCAKALGGDSGCTPVLLNRMRELVVRGQVENCIQELLGCIEWTENDEELKAINDLVRYYRNHQARMNYPEYQAKGYPIGTGVIESAHRHVIQDRMKKSGQHWSKSCAQTMVRLRAAYRTAGAKHFYQAIRRAEKTTRMRPMQRALPIGRRRKNQDGNAKMCSI